MPTTKAQQNEFERSKMEEDKAKECKFCGEQVNGFNNYSDEWNNKYWDVCYDCGIAKEVKEDEDE